MIGSQNISSAAIPAKQSRSNARARMRALPCKPTVHVRHVVDGDAQGGDAQREGGDGMRCFRKSLFSGADWQRWLFHFQNE